jgi:2,4-dienoyl-CoA reductase-like NADH-dependent reductase (Old Yellow Enzyme family)
LHSLGLTYVAAVDDSVVLAKCAKELGVDLIGMQHNTLALSLSIAHSLGPDCSSGGNSAQQKVHPVPGYQVPFAERIRKEAAVLTGAVGLITEPHHAEEVLVSLLSRAVDAAAAMPVPMQ